MPTVLRPPGCFLLERLKCIGSDTGSNLSVYDDNCPHGEAWLFTFKVSTQQKTALLQKEVGEMKNKVSHLICRLCSFL